jgi:hypothetical protein
LITTEAATLNHDQSRRFFDAGCVAVDMETSAVAEVCGGRGVPWSVYRCIGDRYFDGLLDERVLALANPDGSGDLSALPAMLAADPGLGDRLGQLAHDATLAAGRAAASARRALGQVVG